MSSGGNDTALLTSNEQYLRSSGSHCFVDSLKSGREMETDNYVKVTNDSGSFVSDSYRNTSLNGCVRSVALGALVSEGGHVSNNNRTNGETTASLSNVVDAEHHEKALQDDTGTAELNAGSPETADLNECCRSHISVPNEESPCPEAVVKDANACKMHGQNSSAVSVEEVNSTLLQLAVAAEAADKLEVPSGEISSASYGCGTDIQYIVYESEQQMEDIMRLITKDLSEPYSIYTYRYFIHNWPRLCYLVSTVDYLNWLYWSALIVIVL
jgi:hypothetical protein